MTIDLRIGAISITGLALDARDADLLRDRIAERLTALIDAGGIDTTAAAALGARVQIRDQMRVADSQTTTMAHAIAGAIYGQIGNQQGPRS